MTRYIPAPEVFARHAASGLTKYAYAEVVAADAECRAAEADLDAAIAEALACGPFAALVAEIRRDWTAEYHIDETHPALVPLWTLLRSDRMPTVAQTGSRSNEMFAVKSWLAAAAKIRRYTTRIRREIAALQPVAA
jgi:hypothetical protein